ncbi:MAG TPA: hypothetical protein VK821_13840 [Dehalococcoidia bacterium]|nr:hypothetical protein [Dehalococcoidia bacterium]
MRFVFTAIVAALRAAAPIRRPLRLVAGAMAIATLAILSSRALPTSADMPPSVQAVVVSMPLQFVPQDFRVPVTSEAVAPIISQGIATTDQPPDSCSPYDSWCSYCTYHAGASVCTAYPPGHLAGSAAPSTTPGVGSPSTAPAGSSAAPVGGGGTSGGGGAAPPR